MHAEMVGILGYVFSQRATDFLHHSGENPNFLNLLTTDLTFVLFCAEGLWETGRGKDRYHFSV